MSQLSEQDHQPANAVPTVTMSANLQGGLTAPQAETPVCPMALFNSDTCQPAWHEFNGKHESWMDDRDVKPCPFFFGRQLSDKGAMSILLALHDKNRGDEVNMVAKVAKSNFTEAFILHTLGRRCPSPHIVDYRGFFHILSTPLQPNGENMGIVLGKADMDLHTYVDRYRLESMGVPELQVWSMLLQMSRALVLTHEGRGLGANLLVSNLANGEWVQIVHRDVKSPNILVSLNGSPLPLLKLADFGGAEFGPDRESRPSTRNNSLTYAREAMELSGDSDGDALEGKKQPLEGSTATSIINDSWALVHTNQVRQLAFWVDDPEDEDFFESSTHSSVSSDTDEISGSEASDSLIEELRDGEVSYSDVGSRGYAEVDDGELLNESYHDVHEDLRADSKAFDALWEPDNIPFDPYDPPSMYKQFKMERPEQDKDERIAHNVEETRIAAVKEDAMDVDAPVDLPDYSDIGEPINPGDDMDLDSQPTSQHVGSDAETIPITDPGYDHTHPPLSSPSALSSITSSAMEQLAMGVVDLHELDNKKDRSEEAIKETNLKGLYRTGSDLDWEAMDDNYSGPAEQSDPPKLSGEPYFIGMRPPEYPAIIPAGDIWALGRVATSMCTNVYRSLEPVEIQSLTRRPWDRDAFSLYSEARKWYMIPYSGHLVDLLQSMTSDGAWVRPTARELLTFAKRGLRRCRDDPQATPEDVKAINELLGDDDNEALSTGLGYRDSPREPVDEPPTGNSGPLFTRHPLPRTPTDDSMRPEYIPAQVLVCE